MKRAVVLFILLCIAFFGCKSKKTNAVSNKLINSSNAIAKKTEKNSSDTIRIANDSLEYELIIIDAGFSSWLASRSFSRGYHSQSYLKNKNILYVNEWNNRVLQPQRYSSNLFEMTIDYDPKVNYGYEVNYLIYNYMIYFQNTYNQKLYGFVPPR